MYAIASCTASILRGTTTNEFGDTVDTDTVIQSGIPFYISDIADRVWDPSTQTPRVIRSIDGQCQSDVDLRIGDRVRDDTNGITYIVNDVTQPYGAGWTSDLDVDLKRITPAL